jgi:hypothetical protein
MSKAALDKVREERIIMKVVVDTHDAEERGMGSYYYLDNKIQFPFTAPILQIVVPHPWRKVPMSK